MGQKEMNMVRDEAYTNATDFTFGNFTYEGRIQEGAVFSDGNGNFAVLKIVMKKEQFADEVYDLMEEFTSKQQAKANKETKTKTKTKTKVTKETEDVANELVDEIIAEQDA